MGAAFSKSKTIKPPPANADQRPFGIIHF